MQPEVLPREGEGDEPLSRENPVPEQRAIIISGIDSNPLATMSEEDFLQLATAQATMRRRLIVIQREAMQEGIDYGVIPGTKNPTLLKSGSEVLCKMIRGIPLFDWERTIGDGEREPAIHYDVTCKIVRADDHSVILGMGAGSCNSHERKYRYRYKLLTCPVCGKDAVMRGKAGQYFCAGGKGGCGNGWAANSAQAKELKKQPAMEVNPDPHDLDNTLLKIAKKRSQVDATLNAACASGTFTQDLEDVQPDDATGDDAGKSAGNQPPAGRAKRKDAPGKKKEEPTKAPAKAAPPPDEELGGEPTAKTPTVDDLKELLRASGVTGVNGADEKLRQFIQPSAENTDEHGRIRVEKLNETQRTLAFHKIKGAA